MKCPVCDHPELRTFFKVDSVPVFCNVIYPTELHATSAPRGTIELGFCDRCGMIYNTAFEAERVEYAPGYENSLYGSLRFLNYAEGLAERLVTAFELKDSHIVEIGSGRGEFLDLLCRHGRNRGTGFDPSVSERETVSHNPSVKIYREPFSSAYQDLRFDLLVSRHVLEHIPEPKPFLGELVSAARRTHDAGLFLEVPNALWTLRDLGIWDVIYEHCSYFTPVALRALLSEVGVHRTKVVETFGGQFLCAAARVDGQASAADDNAGDLADLKMWVEAFQQKFEMETKLWNDRFLSWKAANECVAIWGAGSKGVSFLNRVNTRNTVSWVVDVNPRKQGQYVAGTGQPIVAPEMLRAAPPTRVIVMNPAYKSEVESVLCALGLFVEVISV